jgi:hypothetical protein
MPSHVVVLSEVAVEVLVAGIIHVLKRTGRVVGRRYSAEDVECL